MKTNLNFSRLRPGRPHRWLGLGLLALLLWPAPAQASMFKGEALIIPYKKVPREKVKLPERSMKGAYDDQSSLKERKFVAEKY